MAFNSLGVIMSKCYVYIIQSVQGSNPPIKLGVANNPEKRLQELQTGNPFKLILIANVEMPDRKSAYGLERWLHDRFSHRRITGEWFWSKGCNLKRAFSDYESLKCKPISQRRVGSRSSNEAAAEREIQMLKMENAILKMKVKRLEDDMIEYLDSQQSS